MHWRFPSAAARRQAEREACEGLHIPRVSARDVWIWARGAWSRGRDLTQPRTKAAAALLSDGAAIVITGGELHYYDNGVEVIRRSIEVIRRR